MHTGRKSVAAALIIKRELFAVTSFSLMPTRRREAAWGAAAVARVGGGWHVDDDDDDDRGGVRAAAVGRNVSERVRGGWALGGWGCGSTYYADGVVGNRSRRGGARGRWSRGVSSGGFSAGVEILRRSESDAGARRLKVKDGGGRASACGGERRGRGGKTDGAGGSRRKNREI